MTTTLLTFYVDVEEEGIRLDRWFKRHRPDVSHTLLAMWMRKGLVRLNGEKADVGARLSADDEISLPALEEGLTARKTPAPARDGVVLTPAEIEQAQAMVIHKDAHALVLNKPPGLATQGGTKTHKHVDGMLDALKFERSDRPKLVHRLDKDTSGVLLIARTPKAASWFAKAFSARDARKVYWALVMGVPRHSEGLIDAPLAKEPGTGGEKMAVDENNGLAAKTFYRVIDTAGSKAAWVELLPHTGRTHQLRVHMAIIGHPIVGDLKYGGKEAMLTGGISRKMHLHARALKIDHPDRKTLEISAPLPRHMQDSWEMLGFDLGFADALAQERRQAQLMAELAPKPASPKAPTRARTAEKQLSKKPHDQPSSPHKTPRKRLRGPAKTTAAKRQRP
jgi:23S rRNA pseudouridine955/2504/2580 synthase